MKRGEPPHAEVFHRGQWRPVNVVLGKSGRIALGDQGPHRG
jgi:hypothetical protein